MWIATIVVLAGLLLQPAVARAQEITAEEAQKVAAYDRYWELADAVPPASPDVQSRLAAAIREAEQEFGGQGPALARHFLRHVQASPGNTAFFFLFRAVGDVETARVLIPALLDPPLIDAQVYGRDAGEIGVGVEALLKNDALSVDPAIVAALQETLLRARQRPGGDRVATIIVSLLGACKAPEATRLLESLASDADASIRFAAVSALGSSPSASAGLVLQRALSGDADPEARARAAGSLAQSGSPEAAASLQASLARETQPSRDRRHRPRSHDARRFASGAAGVPRDGEPVLGRIRRPTAVRLLARRGQPRRSHRGRDIGRLDDARACAPGAGR